MTTIIKIWAIVMGIVMSFGYYPQLFKILKNKSVKDISLASYIIWSLGTLTWIIYGVVVKDMIIVISFALGVVGSWSVLFLRLFYKPKTEPNL